MKNFKREYKGFGTPKSAVVSDPRIPQSSDEWSDDLIRQVFANAIGNGLDEPTAANDIDPDNFRPLLRAIYGEDDLDLDD